MIKKLHFFNYERFVLTIHSFTTVSLLSAWMASVDSLSFVGKLRSNFFFSSPISDVQSIFPIPFPSPSFFSQTLNVTPQLLISWVSFLRCIPFGSPLFLQKSSLSSNSIASSIRLDRRTSVNLRRRWHGVHLGLCGQVERWVMEIPHSSTRLFLNTFLCRLKSVTWEACCMCHEALTYPTCQKSIIS